MRYLRRFFARGVRLFSGALVVTDGVDLAWLAVLLEAATR